MVASPQRCFFKNEKQIENKKLRDFKTKNKNENLHDAMQQKATRHDTERNRATQTKTMWTELGTKQRDAIQNEPNPANTKQHDVNRASNDALQKTR